MSDLKTNALVRTAFALLRKAQSDDEPVLDLIGTSFTVTGPTLFGAVNEDYVDRELEWYMSRSLNVKDIPGGPPKIWRQVADSDGLINSNYGYLLFSPANGMQYQNVLAELRANQDSRRAVAIYTRPEMHYDATAFGMNDFICTNAVHYRIRKNELHVVVQMRSNDAVFGFRNDYAWQSYVQNMLVADLHSEYPNLQPGDIVWQTASLHVYRRHFYLVDHFIETGEYDQPLKSMV